LLRWRIAGAGIFDLADLPTLMPNDRPVLEKFQEYRTSPFKVTGKISYFLSAFSVPLRFKSSLSNHRGAENTEKREIIIQKFHHLERASPVSLETASKKEGSS
jgi:hypothetical protein